MSNDTFCNARVSFWQRIGLLGIIAAFLVMGNLRLNDCDLFNPDSPRYVLYSQSIVDLGEYRATDLPGSPVYTWRPPGLSMLLAPVLAFRPYDVVAAKVVVLLTGVLLLWVLFQFSLLHCSGWEAICVTALVASGPSFFVMSTEVLTEVPYTVGVMVVLTILSRSAIAEAANQIPRNRSWRIFLMVIAGIALAFTPWLRTAGVALVVATGLWVVTSRSRIQWIPVVSGGVFAFGLLAWRNKQAGGENYIGSMMTRLTDHGLVPLINSGFETIGHYVRSIPGLMLPGVMTERAWYSPLLLAGQPSLGVPFVIGAVLAATLVSLAFVGMCRRWACGGSLVILYVLIYAACLIVWPWRHERFLWPLIPIVMSFIPAGWSFLFARLPQKAIARLPSIFMLLLCGWQTIGCGQIVCVNRQFVSQRDAFHRERNPSFYYSNWRRAGEWLNANSAPSSRVLAWHAAVGGTSHRFQKRVQFETLSPHALRQQIENFSARYLVVPEAQFGDGFSWRQLGADPALNFTLVYREQDVAILEVEPNRTGEIHPEKYRDWLIEQIQSAEKSRDRNPDRIDLEIRYASLLREADRADEAIGLLRNLVDRGVKTVRVCSELGWMYFEKQEYADAATFLDLARTLPNAESMANTLADAATQARKRSREGASNATSVSVDRRLNLAKSLLNSLKFDAARNELERITEQAPDHPEGVFLLGQLHHRFGKEDQAIVCYERAVKMGVEDAKKWLNEIHSQRAIASDLVSSKPDTSDRTIDDLEPSMYVTAASLSDECGWPGRALATLERANKRFPNHPSIQRPLADLYCRFARSDLAVPLYESVMNQDSTDELAQKGLAIARANLREPQMRSRKERSANNQYAGVPK